MLWHIPVWQPFWCHTIVDQWSLECRISWLLLVLFNWTFIWTNFKLPPPADSPACKCALWSETCGDVDSHRYFHQRLGLTSLHRPSCSLINFKMAKGRKPVVGPSPLGVAQVSFPPTHQPDKQGAVTITLHTTKDDFDEKVNFHLWCVALMSSGRSQSRVGKSWCCCWKNAQHFGA